MLDPPTSAHAPASDGKRGAEGGEDEGGVQRGVRMKDEEGLKRYSWFSLFFVLFWMSF